ncbi:MAG: radical SAM protein [bacterium]
MYSVFNSELRTPRFSLEENIDVVSLNGKYILISPDTGGWAVLDNAELYKVFLPNLDQKLGMELYKRGIAKKNGISSCTTRDLFETSRMTYFEFQLTNGCNLKCNYCNINAKAQSEATRATFDIAERLIDRIIEYCLKHTIFGVTVQFSGGEPFTNFDVMEYTCHYVSERLAEEKFPKKLCFQAQTNLAFSVEAKHLELIKKFQIGLGISLDGPKEYHDTHRKFPDGKGSWDLIMENLLKLKSEGINYGVLSVVTPESVSGMRSTVEFLLNNGINGFALAPLLPTGRGFFMNSLDPKEYVRGLFEVFDEVCIPFYKATGEIPLEREFGLALLNFIQPSRHYMCWRSPCGAGTNMCSITPSGYVFPCGLWVNEPNFKIGNIYDNNFDEMISSDTALMLRRRTIDSLEECSSCFYRAWCQSRCPFSSYAYHGDIFKPSGYCEITKELFSELLKRATSNGLDDEPVHTLVHKMSLIY